MAILDVLRAELENPNVLSPDLEDLVFCPFVCVCRLPFAVVRLSAFAIAAAAAAGARK